MVALEEVVDSVIDKFDQEDLKGSTDRVIGIGLPANYMFINMFAHPNKWGELPQDQLIVAEVTVKVRLSIDIS